MKIRKIEVTCTDILRSPMDKDFHDFEKSSFISPPPFFFCLTRLFGWECHPPPHTHTPGGIGNAYFSVILLRSTHIETLMRVLIIWQHLVEVFWFVKVLQCFSTLKNKKEFVKSKCIVDTIQKIMFWVPIQQIIPLLLLTFLSIQTLLFLKFSLK